MYEFESSPRELGLVQIWLEGGRQGRDCQLHVCGIESKVASVPCLGDWGLVQILLEEERGAVYQGERAGELQISNIEL